MRNIDDQSSQNPLFLPRNVKDIVNNCREYSHAPIVLGGAGYSIYPKSARTYLNADFGIQGEGEIAFPLLLNALQNNATQAPTPELFSKEKASSMPMKWCDCIDEHALREPDILSASSDNSKDRWITVRTLRGCPLHCNYCSTPTIEEEVLRMRSPITSFPHSQWIGELASYAGERMSNSSSDSSGIKCVIWICLDSPMVINNISTRTIKNRVEVFSLSVKYVFRSSYSKHLRLSPMHVFSLDAPP